jgi:hypothetical protein
MATNTTLLGLIKPDYVDDVDIADINSNMDDIDSAVGATICTSTTRPGTPFTGQLIFETNTDKFLVWTGSVWEESVGGAEALNDLTDVTITTPAAGQVLVRSGSAWINKGAPGFTASATITATDASWPVPSLGSPIVKVTVIGGGGGGGASNTNNGGAGGTTTFNAGGGGSVSASGGAGGPRGDGNIAGSAVADGFVSGNGGMPGVRGTDNKTGVAGLGGQTVVAYLNLTGISTVNVTIGAGGAGGAAGSVAGAAGGRGEVIVEYVAA